MKNIVFLLLFLFLVAIAVSFLPKNSIPSVSPITAIISAKPFSRFPSLMIQKDVMFPTVSLGQIFTDDHSWTATLSAEKKVTLIATGDVIPARSVNYKTLQAGDFRWPFAKTADVVSSGDITLINLETPLLKDCPVRNDGMIFCGDARHMEGLTLAGVDVASIANNHAGNWGKAGIDETRSLLAQAGIQISGGDDQPVIKEVKGVRFGFVAFNDIDHEEAGIAWAHDKTIATEILEARNVADVVIASFHWGPEYVRQPHPRQVELAHLAIDSGADVVIGNHPHWIQPVELYKGRFIMYAHGNYIFDQEWSEETKLGVIGKYTFYDKQLVDVEYLPIRIVDYGQPYFLEGEEKGKTLDILYQASREYTQVRR